MLPMASANSACIRKLFLKKWSAETTTANSACIYILFQKRPCNPGSHLEPIPHVYANCFQFPVDASSVSSKPIPHEYASCLN